MLPGTGRNSPIKESPVSGEEWFQGALIASGPGPAEVFSNGYDLGMKIVEERFARGKAFFQEGLHFVVGGIFCHKAMSVKNPVCVGINDESSVAKGIQ